MKGEFLIYEFLICEFLIIVQKSRFEGFVYV